MTPPGNANVSLEFGFSEANDIQRVLYFCTHGASKRTGKDSPIIADLAGKRRNHYTTASSLLRLLREFCREHPYPKRFETFVTSSAHDDDAIQRAQKWSFANFRESIDIEGLAAKVGMSPRNFARRFKAATGEAPLAYLHRLRIASARHYLESAHRSSRSSGSCSAGTPERVRANIEPASASHATGKPAPLRKQTQRDRRAATEVEVVVRDLLQAAHQFDWAEITPLISAQSSHGLPKKCAGGTLPTCVDTVRYPLSTKPSWPARTGTRIPGRRNGSFRARKESPAREAGGTGVRSDS